LGVAGGAVFGALLGATDSTCYDEIACGRADNAGVGSLVFGVLGLPVGMIVGALVKTDRWEDSALSPGVRGSLSPLGQLQVSVSVRFGRMR